MGTQALRLYADFNGLFGQLVCLSHEETCRAPDDSLVAVVPGMVATAWQQDEQADGSRDDLLAHGIVEPAPDWLQCRGSRWVLRIDARSVRHESDLRPKERADYE